MSRGGPAVMRPARSLQALCDARADQRARPVLNDQRGTLADESAERRPIIDLGGYESILLQEEDRPQFELRALLPASA